MELHSLNDQAKAEFAGLRPPAACVHRSGLRCWKCGMFSEVTGENPERILSSLDNFGKRRAAAQDPLPFLYVGMTGCLGRLLNEGGLMR